MIRRARTLFFMLVGACSLFVLHASAVLGSVSVAEVSNAITELDVQKAREMVRAASSDSPALAFERARLSIYTGDCDAASATLSSLEQTPQVRDLLELARSCARATAASTIVQDEANGLWIRLQDDGDRALLPFLTNVVVRARAVVERDVGTTMPRPLRIDLVRDLFTLSAVSGLPLRAAETTGTVAVARWGRVTMLSPRAAPAGYPWEDTLAHEITHLALSRATRDGAPLWLQEGLAKHEETQWRSPRPFDRTPAAEGVARTALETGESVGVDKLGPSIAMLPTPRAASIAFAEVQAFVEHFMKEKGSPAFRLLVMDLKGLGDDGADSALRSVTGYDLAQWVLLFEHHLGSLPPDEEDTSSGPAGGLAPPRSLARSVRLGDLLSSRGSHGDAAERYAQAHGVDPKEPAIRWRLGRALVSLGRDDEARQYFGATEDLAGGHAGWYAIRGRLLGSSGDSAAAKTAFSLAVANNPYLEEAACEGGFRAKGPPEPPLPSDPTFRALCEVARKIPRD